jgi:hypothetical protein
MLRPSLPKDGGSSEGPHKLGRDNLLKRALRRDIVTEYTKPEVVVLGEAVHFIENRISKTPLGILETLTRRNLAPAYDLDD